MPKHSYPYDADDSDEWDDLVRIKGRRDKDAEKGHLPREHREREPKKKSHHKIPPKRWD